MEEFVVYNFQMCSMSDRDPIITRKCSHEFSILRMRKSCTVRELDCLLETCRGSFIAAETGLQQFRPLV